jgi:hypothetical protein
MPNDTLRIPLRTHSPLINFNERYPPAENQVSIITAAIALPQWFDLARKYRFTETILNMMKNAMD